jgi:serine/threonine-protein kinase
VAKGGLARLVLALDEAGAAVILREMHPYLVWNLHLRRCFVKGTRVRERLGDHAHIVRSLERGTHHLRPYEIIEHVDGVNLRECMRRSPGLITANALVILKQAASAIAHMHALGFAHLDIKAENFIVSEDGDSRVHVRLTDFDLSRPLGQRRDRHRSGTASYMAPELLTSGCIGCSSDIFAFGVMAYYLVTGRKPFETMAVARSRRGAKEEFRYAEIKEPARFNPEIAPKLNWLILRCLEHDPDKRFPSMDYLCQEIGSG